MSATLWGDKNDYAQERITDTQASNWSNHLSDAGRSFASWLGAGVLRPDMFTAAAVAGQLKLDIIAGPNDFGVAIVGEAGNELPVTQAGAVRIGVAQGIVASVPNWVFRRQFRTDPLDPATAFVVNQTGTRPANTVYVVKAVFGTTAATSVDSRPPGRVNLQRPTPREISLWYPGTPGANAKLLTVGGVVFTLRAGLPGAYLKVGANPSSAEVYTFKKNGVTVGSVSIATTGAATWTFTADVAFLATDEFSIVGPVTATAVDIRTTIFGEYA